MSIRPKQRAIPLLESPCWGIHQELLFFLFSNKHSPNSPLLSGIAFSTFVRGQAGICTKFTTSVVSLNILMPLDFTFSRQRMEETRWTGWKMPRESNEPNPEHGTTYRSTDTVISQIRSTRRNRVRAHLKLKWELGHTRKDTVISKLLFVSWFVETKCKKALLKHRNVNMHWILNATEQLLLIVSAWYWYCVR